MKKPASKLERPVVKVVVTGATGVIGRRVVPQLVAAGHNVTVMVRPGRSRRDATHIGTSVREADLFNPESLRRVVAGHDVVINLATHMPPSSFRMLLRSSWRENDRIRSQGSANLATAAIGAGVPRFIQESFAPVYPDRGDSWIDEDTLIEPVAYNRTIADAERSAERFSTRGGIGIVLRFAQFYGADALQTRDTIDLVRRGWAPMPGPPDAYVTSVSHADAARAVSASIELPAGIYNVAEDDPVTHRVYFDTLAAALHVAPPRLPPTWLTPLFGSAGEMMARSTRVCNAKLKQLTDWTPKLPSVREAWPQIVAELNMNHQARR